MVGEQCHRVRACAAIVRREKVSEGGLHAQNLEEVAHHHEAGGGLGHGETGEAGVVRRAEREVSGDTLIDAALIAESFVAVGGKGGGGESAARWRPDPRVLIGFGFGLWL